MTPKPWKEYRAESPNKDGDYPADPLTVEEFTALLGKISATSAAGIRNRALIILLYRSGLRISEALALKVSDIDLKNHAIRLPFDTKIGEPQTRGLHPSGTDAIARWIEVRRSLGIQRGPLFCTLKGKPMHPQQARNMLHYFADKASLAKRVHPHGLRHTYAVQLRRTVRDVGAISKLLGHKDIRTTVRYINHLTNYDAISELEKADLPPLEES